MYELKNIGLTYNIGNRAITIIEDFNLSIVKGEFIVLMGPSGSGKTTLLNMLAGFLSPSKGSIIFQGHDLYRLASNEVAVYRNQEIGMIHQFFNLIKEFSAIKNIMTPMLIRGEGANKAREKAEELLDKVKLLHRANHYPSELSGGEQQRVAIARALINNPKIILADEPTGNLDRQTSSEILEIMNELHKDGRTFIVATHDSAVAKIGTRTIDFDGTAVGA